MADASACAPETEILIEEVASGPLEIPHRDERHLSSSVVSLAVQDDQWLFAPPPGSPRTGASRIKRGEYRYLRGASHCCKQTIVAICW